MGIFSDNNYFGTFLLYSFLTVSIHYLLSRAEITRWLWSKYPPWLDRWALCPACSGTWIAGFIGILGALLKLSFLGLPGRNIFTVIAIALCGTVWTPILGYLHIKCLLLSSGDSGDDNETTPTSAVTDASSDR